MLKSLQPIFRWCQVVALVAKMAKDIRLITDINHNMSKMLKLGINYSNSCVGIWHIRGTLTPLENVFDVDFALLFILMWSRSTWRMIWPRRNQLVFLLHPTPLASPCLCLPAVFIAAPAAGHLDQQDWLTKKWESILTQPETPCRGRSQGNDHPDQHLPRRWTR